MNISGSKGSKLNFTKSSLVALVPPEKGRLYVYDQEVRGLGIYVLPSGTKTFFFYRRINNRPKKITIGRFPEVTVPMARKIALELANEINQGNDPIEERQTRRKEATLRELFSAYLEHHAKSHKKSWKYDQEQFDRHCAQLAHRKISELKRSDVQKLHTKIGKDRAYTANRILSLLHCMFNLAENLVGFQGKNPAHGIKKFTEKSRDRFLSKEEIGRFLEALEREPSDTIRDFFMVALLTGTRKQEILNMRWADIDFKEGTWNLTDPIKSRDPQKVILSGPVIEILQLREDKNPNGLPWVFPGKSGTDRLKDPRRGWVRILNRAGLENLRIHDLRRTFGSWQAITGASLLIIGKSLNHRNQSTTQIYARLNLDPVRESVEKATEAMLSKKSKPK